MKSLRAINISAAIIATVCFFLPWEQVSCGGARDSLNGLDLARHGHGVLWFVAVLMAGVVLLGALRAWRVTPRWFAIMSLCCGAIAAALMNRERSRVRDESVLITAQLTGWFWLGFFSALAVAISALVLLFKKEQAR